MIYKDYFTPSTIIEENHLEHHGVLGMKWGVRRYQNADGSLTAKGKARVSEEYKKAMDKGDNFMSQTLLDFIESNESCKKAQDLVKQYGMEKWDDLVKTNEAGIRELRSLVFARENTKGREEIEKNITGKKEDVRNQKLQKRAAELASKYGDKATVEVKDNKILVTTSDGDKWRVY